jgi:hypothetical protein
MWTSDDFPGAQNVPWQLLIRARYVHEIDAVVASLVFNQLAAVASTEIAAHVAAAGRSTVHTSDRATAEQKVAAMSAIMDWDGPICGTRYPGWWHHGPRPHFEGISDPICSVAFAKAAELVNRAGSEELQKNLGSVLTEGFAV